MPFMRNFFHSRPQQEKVLLCRLFKAEEGNSKSGMEGRKNQRLLPDLRNAAQVLSKPEKEVLL